MFGCPSYTVDDTLFGFLVSDGLVLTKLLEEDQFKAFQIPSASVFEHKGRVVKNWIEVSPRNQDALPEILKWLWKSYEPARTPQHQFRFFA